ncbi:DarT1-associated NADAR antitoxin family protein [Terrisporobacter vanillatitrophus]
MAVRKVFRVSTNDNILEISTKSPNELGVKLSAININKKREI